MLNRPYREVMLECAAQFDALRAEWDATNETDFAERGRILQDVKRVNGVWFAALEAQQANYHYRHCRPN